MIRNERWKTEEEEFDALSVMSNISRYNTRYRIKNESVAAHSFYVMWFVSNICSELGVGPDITSLALEAALVHDMPEIYINDVTYDCKKMIPGLNSILAEYEIDILNSLSTTAAKVLFYPETMEEKIAGAIVRYADVVSVKQYSQSEIKLGNKSFLEILKGAEDRLNEISYELTTLLIEGGYFNA